MIVRGDRLAESERVNTLRVEHAGLWALLLSNPALVDDFGLLRWEPAQVVSKLFPRRAPAPLRAVRSFMAAVEQVGLVRAFEVERVRFAEVFAWSGVEPSKRRWHRSPLPPWKTHSCVAACAKSGARVALAWRQDFNNEIARTDAPDESPDVDPPFGSLGSCGSPTSSGSSGPLGSSGNGNVPLKEEVEETAQARTDPLCDADSCHRHVGDGGVMHQGVALCEDHSRVRLASRRR